MNASYKDTAKDAVKTVSDAAENLADTLRQIGQSDRAVEVLTQALSYNPSNQNLTLTLGRALIESGRPDQAIGALVALVLSIPLWLVPPLVLIFLVLGTIFIGLATPTEAGALGAVGALILAGLRRVLSRALLWDALQQTARLTCFVLFILIGSSLFSLVFRALGGDLWVEHLFTQLPGGVWGFLLVVNALLFILGCFLDFFEIVFIVIPLLVPILHHFGISPVWFGVMVAMNLQTSFLTPPFGFSLFYLKSVAPPSLSTQSLYRGVVPFILLQLLMVAALMLWPELVLKASDTLDNTPTPSAQLALQSGTSSGDAIRLFLQIAAEQAQSPSPSSGAQP